MTKSPRQPNFQKNPGRPYGPYEANLALAGLQAAHGRRLRDCGIVDMIAEKLQLDPTAKHFSFDSPSRFLAYRETSPLSTEERTLGVMLDATLTTESGLTVRTKAMFPAVIEAPDSAVQYSTFTEVQAREVGSMVAQLEDWERQGRLPGIDPLLTHIPLVVGEPGTPEA